MIFFRDSLASPRIIRWFNNVVKQRRATLKEQKEKKKKGKEGKRYVSEVSERPVHVFNAHLLNFTSTPM